MDKNLFRVDRVTPRSKVYPIRFTPEEYAAVAAEAKALNIGVADLIRIGLQMVINTKTDKKKAGKS